MFFRYTSSRLGTRYDPKAAIVALSLALLLALPMLGMYWADPEMRQKWENRPLASFPTFGVKDAEDRFFQQLDDYLNDHFGFALEMNRLYRRLVFLVFGDSPAEIVTIGRDEFLFLNAHPSAPAFSAFEAVCSRAMDQQYIERIIAGWSTVLNYYSQKGYRVSLLIVPSKPVVYPEKLGNSVPRPLRDACTLIGTGMASSAATALVEWGQQSGMSVVYPLQAFRQQRDRGNFYPKENFHFSGASAYLMSREALEAMGYVEPENSSSSFREAASVSDLSRILGFEIPIQISEPDLPETGMVKQFGRPHYVSGFYERGHDLGMIENNAATTQRRALMLSNSFGFFLVDKLVDSFTEIAWVNTNNLQESELPLFLKDFVDRFAPDELIFVFHDGGISRGIRWAGVLEEMSANEAEIVP